MNLVLFRPLLIAFMSTALVQCERPQGMGEPGDPTPILGCYKAAVFQDDMIIITSTDIRLNGRQIYSRYEYGTTRKGQQPYIYGYPRGFLWADAGKLGFGASDGGSSATLDIPGSNSLRLPVFPTSDVSDFGAEIRLVTFSRTNCPSGTVSTGAD